MSKALKYNRTEAASALLSEIESWCARTGTPEGHIGHVLFLHPGFVGLLRLRLTLSEEREIAVRQFIYHDHQDGWRGELPKTHGNGTKPVVSKIRAERGGLPGYSLVRLTEAQIAARRVDRDACQKCGVRADVGCKHLGWPA